MVVVDASVIVAYASGDERFAAARLVLSGRRGQLLAPHLIDAEVGHALRRVVATGGMEVEEAERFLFELVDMPLQRSPHGFLLEAAWGMRSKVSFYDALYLALGKLMQVPVATFDRGLAEAASGFGVEAELLA